MTDMEKIESLKQCLSASCRGFRTCPYNDTAWDAIETVLELLAEQEPVKPIFDEDDVSGRCGVCGHALTHQSMVGNVLVDEWYQYCPICGRRVDWNA